jgi:hypothetical protein
VRVVDANELNANLLQPKPAMARSYVDVAYLHTAGKRLAFYGFKVRASARSAG